MPPRRQKIAGVAPVIGFAFLLATATVGNAFSSTSYPCDMELSACIDDGNCTGCGALSSSGLDGTWECEFKDDLTTSTACETLGAAHCCNMVWSGEDGCLNNSILLAYWDCTMANHGDLGCSMDDFPCMSGAWRLFLCPWFQIECQTMSRGYLMTAVIFARPLLRLVQAMLPDVDDLRHRSSLAI